MDREEYIKSLENLLIFMCQTHEDQSKSLLELAKEGNDAFFKIPKIQGTGNLILISQLADMEFQQPTYGFYEVRKEILKKKESLQVGGSKI